MVGSGPNGLAAAITLVRAGCSVLVLEAAPTIGGGMRTAAHTLPGFSHDVCSTIHALAMVSPFFQSIPQQQFEQLGLHWEAPPAAVAHPLDGGQAVIARTSLEETAESLEDDRDAYQRLLASLVADADKIFAQTLGPFRLPRHWRPMLKFGLLGARSAVHLARRRFRSPQARALFAGMAAHSVLPLENAFTAAVGLMLSLSAHSAPWPVARGGSQKIADALGAYLQSLGGEIVTSSVVRKLADLPPVRAVFFDTSPGAMCRIAGDALPSGYRRRLAKYRYGPGVFKVDWALDGPIPWTAADCSQAATVHVGGSLAEIAESERACWQGRHAEPPFVLLAQATLFDPTRAPAGQHTAWGYCHVPHGSTTDMTAPIEGQIERFAPGFGQRILARRVMNCGDFESYNANNVGGDITGGVMDAGQLFTRPVFRFNPYTTPNPKLFLCSASTPPGGGVHGMCGYYAAKAALKSVFGP